MSGELYIGGRWVEGEGPELVSTDAVETFRAVRARVAIDGATAHMTAEVADALKVRAGDPVRVKA